MAKLRHMFIAATLLGASSALACALPGAARADDRARAADVLASLEAYARELDDPDLSTRQAATDRLVGDPTIETDVIIEFVKSRWGSLPPEAVERFLMASRQRYIDNPGAIGIQFGESDIAVIQTVIDGTPAARVLQPGDQFLALNGQLLPERRAQQQPELLKRMAGCRAGDVVKARIRRGMRELDVEFALADPRGLPRFEDFIAQMQREMAQKWDEIREKELPPDARLLIDMNILPAGQASAAPVSLSGGVDDAQLIEAFNRRRVEVSRDIARVMESSSDADSPERRRELESQYLPLIDEFARLNARLRLLEASASGRRRR
ncbi:MAG: PDZ domain-containing protein [Phycisphaerales bacterium]|nr:PDZ domain-containing protein [Phycisphaerales bacterium]